MHPWRCVLERVDLDYPTHLAPEFRGNPGGIDGQRIDVIGVDLRTKPRRAVVRERDSIKHKLGLIFRSSGMKHRVAFIRPAGLRIHQVLQRTAGQ